MLNAAEQTKRKIIPNFDCTRYTGSQCDKGNSIDSVFEIDKAAQVSGHISDDGGTQTDEDDGNNECWVAGTDSLSFE